MRVVTSLMALLVFIAGSATISAAPQHPTAATGQADVWSADRGQWMPLPDVFPPGGQFKVVYGNPATGAATFYMRFPRDTQCRGTFTPRWRP